MLCKGFSLILFPTVRVSIIKNLLTRTPSGHIMSVVNNLSTSLIETEILKEQYLASGLETI